jgi:hypothetical protein
MNPETDKRKKWLRRAGLIVGLAGVLWLLFLSLAISESPFSWYAVPTMLIVAVPFLSCVLTAWKWPLAGGILLILWGLFWPANILLTLPPGTPMPPSILIIVLPISLPSLLVGILFSLSRQGHGIPKVWNWPTPKLRQAGLVIMALAGLSSFLYEFLSRYYMEFDVVGSLMTGLFICSGFVLLTIATWAQPLWGGLIGVGYPLLIIASFVITQTADRSLLEMLWDLRFYILPIAILLVGSILVLASVRPKAGFRIVNLRK